MSASIFQTISIVGFVMAGILVIIAVICFLKFDIPAVIGELSGKTAEKQVKEIREATKKAVAKRSIQVENSKPNMMVTESLNETEVLIETPETVLLEEETTLLQNKETVFELIQDTQEVHTSERI